MARILVQGAAKVFTFDAHDTVHTDADVMIDGDAIESVGTVADPERVDCVIDASGHVVLPGFVNTHHHFFQHVTRAVPGTFGSTILEWLRSCYVLWSGLDPEIVHAAALAAGAELLLSGCTTAADFFYLFPRKQHGLFNEEVSAVKELGLRFHGVRGCTPVLEGRMAAELADLGIDPSDLLEDELDIFAASERAIETHHDAGERAMVRVALGPTQTHYESPEFMRRLKRLANEYGVGTHVHLHPRPDERKLLSDVYDSTPLDFLDDVGWLDERTWLAHATEHRPEEIDKLAARGTGVAHCPGCITRLGFSVTRIPMMLRKGVKVGVGVDGGASNDAGAMLAELRAVLMIHRIKNAHPELQPSQWLTPKDVFRMATTGGAAVLGRTDIGRLEVGSAADMVLVKTDTLGLAGTFDPLGALLFNNSAGAVDYTIVGGRVVVENGRLASGREREIIDGANRAARTLARRAQEKTGMDFGYGWQ